MPPSWLNKISLDPHHIRSQLPDLEHIDWSRGLGNTGTGATFAEGLLSTSNIALHGEICALAVEPVLGYLAVGTTQGSIHLFGKEAVQVDWTLRPANKVTHLLFKSGSPLLIVIDVKDNISIFDLSRNDPQIRAKSSASPHPFQPTQATTVGAGPSGPLHPDTPMRIGAHTVRNSILCAEVSPLHNHLFLGLRDGTIDAYDLERLSPSPYRVPNLWWEEEEILRKSGVPDAPNRRHVPLIIDIKTHPKDINQLLLAYEGGVVLLDVTKRTILRSFQLRHLPGAPGSCVGNPDLVWTERAAPATCVAWRPDGLVFACGHEDGCISFWHIEDDEKPITVRTIERTDVDRSETLMNEPPGGFPHSREPIFKLAWSGFPAQSWFDMAQNAKGKSTDNSSQQHQQADQAKEEPATGTILTILGGATERQPQGLICLHFPAFSWPYASYWNSKTPETLAKTRQALHASLEETKGSRYSTPSPVEDFILLPRDNPYYGGAYDPLAVITLLAADPKLPPLPPPAAARGLKAFAFPPPAESLEAPSVPMSPGKKGNLGIQLPFAQRSLQLPLTLSTAGPGAILGAQMVDVTPHVYRNLTAQEDANREKANPTSPKPDGGFASVISSTIPLSAPRKAASNLPLFGGKAKPTASGMKADTAEAFAALARAERWRILVTWHLDGTVRFHDASPQLLLQGTDQIPLANSSETAKATTPGYLQKSFPSPLPHLTIDTHKLIFSSSMIGHPLFEKLKSDPMRLRIVKVVFAAESNETAIVLRSGQVLHYKFGFAKYSQTDEVIDAVQEEVQQDEEMAASFAHHHSPSPSSPGVSRASMNELDSSMAGAMQDLNIHLGPSQPSTQGSAPPRPRRDPKRMSALGRSSGGSEFRSSEDYTTHQAPPTNFHAAPVRIDEITFVNHLATWRSDGFKPNIIVELNRGEVTAIDLSNIGFLAIAYGISLAVIDLRVPHLIVREGFGTPAQGDVSREERKMIEEENKSTINHLLFSICRTAANPILSPTLIASRESGYTTLWTLGVDQVDMWICTRSNGVQLDELQKGVAVQVVDMAGNVCQTIPGELQRSLREQSRGGDMREEKVTDMNLMLCVGRNSLSLRAGLTGPKVAKVDIGEAIQGASVIDRRGDKVCLAVTSKSFHLFTLPHLRSIKRIQRHNRAYEEKLSIANVCLSLDGSGDMIEIVNSLDVCMWTVFATQPRPGLPNLLLYTPPSMPIAPNVIGSMASSVVNWIGGKSASLTQVAQLDDILAGGPGKRGAMPKLPEQKYIYEKVEEQERREALQEEMQRRAELNNGRNSPFVRQQTKSAQTSRQTNAAADQAAWSLDLAKQRGELVNSLEQGLSNLEKGASDWMKSTRENMIKQAAKDKLNKYF